MKLLTLLVCVTITKGDVLNNRYLPPKAHMNVRSNFYHTPNQFSSAVSHQSVNAYFGTPITVLDTQFDRPQAARDRNAAILIQDQSRDGDTYSYVYKTGNGIYAEEKGIAINGVRAQGGYSYMGDDGRVYSVRYTADENGFVAQGDHLPTPPPIPKEILRALEQNARDEAAGIFDDGSYNEAKYSSSYQKQHYTNNMQPNNYHNNNRIHDDAVQKMYLPPRTRRNYQRNQYTRLKNMHRNMYMF
ncbi:unnamed protein product [Arctia plantaginis]|uniref:Uncharacterized protein n=1 Tax=Arctia plantaginis TaxID=874455 RepID=A0A8S0ZA90_ARCPL|nr:unnamed protein product [Arctia plantaginis]